MLGEQLKRVAMGLSMSTTLRRKISTTLFVGTFGLLACAVCFQYFTYQHQLYAQLEQKGQASVTRLMHTLPAPVWNFMEEDMTKHLDVELTDNEIYAVMVRTNEGVWTEMIGEDSEPHRYPYSVSLEQAHYKTFSAPILYQVAFEEKHIGDVSVFISDAKIQSLLTQFLIRQLSMAFGLAMMMFLLYRWMLNRVVDKFNHTFRSVIAELSRCFAKKQQAWLQAQARQPQIIQSHARPLEKVAQSQSKPAIDFHQVTNTLNDVKMTFNTFITTTSASMSSNCLAQVHAQARRLEIVALRGAIEATRLTPESDALTDLAQEVRKLSHQIQGSLNELQHTSIQDNSGPSDLHALEDKISQMDQIVLELAKAHLHSAEPIEDGDHPSKKQPVATSATG